MMTPEEKKQLTDLQDKVKELTQTVAELKKNQEDTTRLQKDYSGQQVFERDIVFRGRVYNRAGTKVIN